MMNYLKSELYRVKRSKGIYITIGSCMFLMIAMNLVLWSVGASDPNFRYDTTKFSYSMLTTGMQTVICITPLICYVVFGEEFKHRTFTNVTAFGYSKMTIFFGKWILTLIVSVIGMVLVVGTLTISGFLLEDSGIGELERMLTSVVVCVPILICGVTGALVFTFLLKNENVATYVWFGVFIGVAGMFSIVGTYFKVFEYLNDWMAFNVLGDITLDKVTGEWSMVWETPDGLIRTILVGALGTLVFLVTGVIGIRKQK